MKLIHNGELKKQGKLHNDLSYIIGSNIGIGKKQASWVVERWEIFAWLERAKERKSI